MQSPGRVRQATLEGLYDRSNLTQRQLLMWIGQKMQPESPEFNMASLFLLDGPLDVPAFRRAARALVESSDALRTFFGEFDGVPQQRVANTIDFDLEEVVIADGPDALSRLRDLARLRTQRPFDLQRPLFRFSIFQAGARRSAWFMNLHHLVGDGWSVRLIFERLSALYEQACAGQCRPAVPHASFADYAAAERAYRETEAFARDVRWWEGTLSSSEPTLFYGETATARSGATRRVRVELGESRSGRLRTLAETNGHFFGLHQSMQNLLTTALYAWAHRTGPNAAPTVALAFHNRTDASQATIGLLVQTFPVRIEIGDDDTFLSILEKLTESSLAALEHRGCAVANPIHKRAWEIVVNYLPTDFTRFAGLEVEHEWISAGVGTRAVTATFHDFSRSGRLTLDFDLLAETFDEARAHQLPSHFLALLDAMLSDITTPVHAVDILGREERDNLLACSGGQAPAVPTTCVGLFEETAARLGSAPAVRDVVGDLSFLSLNADANRLARRLEGLGVGPGQWVAIHLRPGPHVPVAVLGVLKAGAAYLPLDPTYPPERLAYMLDDAETGVVITEEQLQGRLSLGGRRALLLDDETEVEARAGLSRVDAPLRATLDDFAYIIYTSGSTGRPKGVRIQHRSLVTFLEAVRHRWIEPGDTLPFTSPLSFDMHLGDLLLPLVVGATIVPLPRQVSADGTRLRGALEELRPSAFFATPATLRMLLDAGWEGLAGLKVMCGGEALPPELAQALLLRVGSLQNVYGPSETTCYVLSEEVKSAEGPIPIGRPLPGVRIYVLDRHLLPLPEGMPGELVIGGPQVGFDYLNRPDLTAERFVSDPFSHVPDARMYRSGDLARVRRDGVVEYLGRIDQQVKIRGYRIELGEIESVLARHEGVRQAVVCAREDTPGDRRLVAYIVGTVDESALKRFLRQRLPEFMVPSAFVTVEQFPVTLNGKVDRAALPAPVRVRSTVEVEAPRDLLQFQITKIFEDVLGLQPVGLHDSFFEVGGNSLLAVRLLAQIERVIDRQIPSLQTLFDAPTPHQLAAVLSRDGWQLALGSVVALQPRGKGPPFFCVHAFIGDVCRDLGRSCGLGNPFYGLQPRGLDGREEPLHTIPEMAAFYIEEMRKVQPAGPYHLGGYSFGGMVAVEMATQLQEMGEQVALLVVIDVGPHNLRPRRLLGRLRACINAPLITLEKVQKMLTEERPTQLLSIVRRKLLARRLKKRAATAGSRGAAADPGEALTLLERMYGMSRWPGNYQRIARINLLALLRYSPRPYDGVLTLIRRRSRLHRFTLEERDWSWHEVATSVDVHFVDGSHDEIMVEPGVRQVGAIIEHKLPRAISSRQPEHLPL